MSNRGFQRAVIAGIVVIFALLIVVGNEARYASCVAGTPLEGSASVETDVYGEPEGSGVFGDGPSKLLVSVERSPATCSRSPF